MHLCGNQSPLPRHINDENYMGYQSNGGNTIDYSSNDEMYVGLDHMVEIPQIVDPMMKQHRGH